MFSEESILIAEDNCYLALDLSLAIEDMNGTCRRRRVAAWPKPLKLLEQRQRRGAQSSIASSTIATPGRWRKC